MATNKHAQIRYTILDRCFSNFNRLYDYDDLLDEVNQELYELGTEGVKLRQLQYDIEHMKSDAGWAIELTGNAAAPTKLVAAQHARVMHIKAGNDFLANLRLLILLACFRSLGSFLNSTSMMVLLVISHHRRETRTSR